MFIRLSFLTIALDADARIKEDQTVFVIYNGTQISDNSDNNVVLQLKLEE